MTLIKIIRLFYLVLLNLLYLSLNLITQKVAYEKSHMFLLLLTPVSEKAQHCSELADKFLKIRNELRKL